MQYSQHPTSQDIISQISFLTDANLTDYVIADRTRNANVAYHKAVALIQKADGKWQFDDANNTTLPIATTTLTTGQKDYGLADYMVEIERVEVKDSSGNWYKIEPKDLRDIETAVDRFEATSGIPKYYDKQGRTLLVYPAPNYTQSASLKVYFKRPASIFTTTDTTKEAGFDEMFHNYIPLYAAYAYCVLYKKDRAERLLLEMKEMERLIAKFYGRRSKDEKPVLRAARISCE